MKERIFIPIICYNHMANTEFMISLIKLTHYLRDNDVSYCLYPIVFESLIPRARNAAAAHFLDSDCSHLLFIDADIEFDPESVLKLLRHNKEVVAGVYPKKYYMWDRALTGEEAVDFPFGGEVHFNQDGLIETSYLPTGFLMIKREVFIKIASNKPELKYKNDIDGYGQLDTFYNFFRSGVHNGIYESEDWGFCSIWRELGGKVLIDPTIKLGHIGWNNFSGNPLKWVQEAINRYNQKQS